MVRIGKYIFSFHLTNVSRKWLQYSWLENTNRSIDKRNFTRGGAFVPYKFNMNAMYHSIGIPVSVCGLQNLPFSRDTVKGSVNIIFLFQTHQFRRFLKRLVTNKASHITLWHKSPSKQIVSKPVEMSCRCLYTKSCSENITFFYKNLAK